MALRFTSSKRHLMDELMFGVGGMDRSSRSALQVLVPCFAQCLDGDELPTPTDVPVAEPIDVPVPTPIDIPPPEPRDVPPPNFPDPIIDPPPKPRPTP